jgi:hypothetical protein
MVPIAVGGDIESPFFIRRLSRTFGSSLRDEAWIDGVPS